MSGIARTLGVAPNTLYWYYRSKDELLVGVLNHLLFKSLQGLPKVQVLSLRDQLQWVLDEFEPLKDLVTTVHARLEMSCEVRDWHERFHQFLEVAVVFALTSKGVPGAKAAMLATISTFLVEGLLVHPHSSRQREDILDWFAQNAVN